MSQHTPLSDARQREQGLAPAASFLVSAPAGSGKTQVLVQRVLGLLATVDEPEEILAITFTRKAAAEMRQRILGALDRAAAGETAQDDSAQAQTLALARAALLRDRERGWHLLEQPWRLQLRTIDSFCNWLSQRMPVLSGLGGQVDLVEGEDAKDCCREAVNRLMGELEGENAQIAEDLECLLSAAHNRWEAVVSFLVDCLQRRNRLLLLLQRVQADPGEETLQGRLEAARRRFSKTQVAAARDMLSPWGEAIMRLGTAAAKRLDKDDFLQAVTGQGMGLPGSDNIPAWQGIAQLLLTGTGSWRKNLTKRDGFPPQCKEEKEELMDILAHLSGSGCSPRPLALLRSMPVDPSFSESQWQLVGAWERLLKQAVAQLRVVFQERGEMDYPQAMLAAQEALQSAPGLAPHLGHSLRHILVDEFQDTSRIQVQLLEQLVGDWQQGEDARSLFLVGDAMQSCYRFRDAEMELFLEARQRGVGGVKLCPLELRSNFRSGKGLVEWSNQRFAALLGDKSCPEDEEEPLPDADSAVRGRHALFSPAEARHNFPTTMSAQLFAHTRGDRAAAKAAEAAEAQRAVVLIREALGETEDGHVAVLVRNRGHLEGIVRVLRQEGISWLAEDVDPLAERPAVQDLMMLTRALINPADKLAWLALLRAPWCALGDRALHAVAVGAAGQTVWQSAISNSLLLESEEQARLTRLTGALAPALAACGRVPLRRLVEGAWLALGGAACLEDGREQEQDVLDFLDLLDDFAMGKPLLRERLEAKLQALYATPAAEGTPRLHLMTIHRAKGLEFDTVLLCGLGRKNPADSGKLLELAPWTSPEGEEQLLAALSVPGQEDGFVTVLRQEEQEKKYAEERRLVYIAVTRAIRRLHLLGFLEKGKREDDKVTVKPARNTLLGTVWDAMEQDFSIVLSSDAEASKAGHAGEEEEEEEEFPVAVPSLRRLPCDWQLPPMPAATFAGAPPPPAPEREDYGFEPGGNLAARHAGTVLHEALERMAKQGLDTWNDRAQAEAVWQARLRGYGLTGQEAAEALEIIALGVQNMLQEEQGRQLLTATEEAELVLASLDESGRLQERRLDCTFLKDEERWVVDYKGSRPRPGESDQDFLKRETERYRFQLSDYVQMFQKMEPGRPVRAALYFPLLNRLHEVRIK